MDNNIIRKHIKPRVFIAIHYLELGGAETSLIGLLHAFDPKKVDVDLFVYSHQGELMKYIPKYVNLLPEVKAYSVIERPIKEAIMAGQFGIAFGRLIAKYKHKRYINSLPEAERTNDISVFPIVSSCIMPYLPDLGHLGEYNLAISYLQPHDIVRNKVRAKKYLAWIHTDYSTVNINVKQELPIWNSYNHIVSISSDVTSTFLQKFPSLNAKIIELENIIPKTIIEVQTIDFQVNWEKETANALNNDNIRINCNTIKVLSIGRFTKQKNFDNVPYICRNLINAGRQIKWYIIGYGGEENLIRENIEKTGMQNNVIILGKRSNPYPYIKSCDLYVQPSRYEGKSITVREAQVLCKPVIITNYPTAHSQINDGVDGIICEQNNEKIAEAIYQLATDKQKQEALIKYLKDHDMSGQSEVEKIYNLID